MATFYFRNAANHWEKILAAVIADAHQVNGSRVLSALGPERCSVHPRRMRAFHEASTRAWIAASAALPVYDALDAHNAIERRMRSLRGLNLHRDSHSILERVARSLSTEN